MHFNKSTIDPFEGIETYFAQHAYALQCIALHRNTIDPFEGIETGLNPTTLEPHQYYRNAIDPFEGILAAPVYRFAVDGAAHV